LTHLPPEGQGIGLEVYGSEGEYPNTSTISIKPKGRLQRWLQEKWNRSDKIGFYIKTDRSEVAHG